MKGIPSFGDWPEERDEAFIADMRADFVESVVRLIGCGLNRAARHRLASGDPSIARLRAYLKMLDAGH